MVSTGTIIIRFLILITVLILLNLYAFHGLKTATIKLAPKWRSIIHWTYWIFSIGLFASVIISFFMFRSGAISFPTLMKFIGVLFSFILAKLVFLCFLFSEDIFRVVRAVIVWVTNFFIENKNADVFTARRAFISQIGLATAALPVAGMVYGMIKGKYDFRLRKETLHYPDLPSSFDGFTITQISDIHSGSFDDRDGVLKGIRMAMSVKSDLLVFTGDLVNNSSEEIEPWLKDFAQLHAPYGKFSILGNHDYGDYISWDSDEAKNKNFQAMKDNHELLGFRLLLNENIHIEKDEEKISLIGVENWGVGFKQKGDLGKALTGVDPDNFKILLSHDPSHWEEEVMDHQQQHIHLTLSGHTHGMQFGVEIGGFKWSPVKYRYPRWAGLYEEAGKFLYVNRGFGFLGFPGRVGIWPEITQITLRKK